VAKKRAEPPESGQVVSVEVERVRTIALLSEHFAQDVLSIEGFEERVEQAYRAASVPALRELTRDLVPAAPAAGAAAALAPAEFTQEHQRITSIMSSTKRRGAWRPARRVDLFCVMSESELDLTQAVLPSGVTEIHSTALMSQVKVIVPPGVRVVLQASSFMAQVSDETMEPPAVGSGAPVVRITGGVMMTELRAIVRQREIEPGGE